MLRLLIVDDEPAILTMLSIALGESFQIATARSAAEALSILKQEVFDLVLTDMRMESATAGYEVVRAASGLQPRPAVAILTAFPIPAPEWRPSGADALLVKGSDILSLPDTLMAMVKAPSRGEWPGSATATRSA